MPADPRLLAHPAVRVEAEKLACARMETFHRLWPPPNPGATPPAWADLSQFARDEHIAVEAALLADVSRPESRASLSLLAARSLAPNCAFVSACFYAEPYVSATGPQWAIEARTETGYHRFIFGESDAGWDPDIAAFHFRRVPGISTVTDPTEALTLAFLAVVR